jgi:hypothetical protein
MGRIKIAIVDSGVRLDHPAWRENPPCVVRKSGLKEGGRCGHGTAIYNIIKKTEKYADIINFQITNKDEEMNYDILVSCLCTIRDEYDVDIINLSLGLSLWDDITQLRQVCSELNEKGVVIVSAFDNIGSISYPAAFENVIGVTTIESCRRVGEFVIFDDDIINIGANGNLQRLAWDTPDYIVNGGNSFACAHVTVQVANFMAEGATGLSEIMEKFRETALQVSFCKNSNLPKKPLFKIESAAIFPFNKEMHSIIRYNDLLSFQISGVYDIRESAYVGSNTAHIMKADVKAFPIKRVEEMDWESFDTLILGNIPSQNAFFLSRMREKLVEKAMSFGKKIFSFDDLRNKYKYERLYCPSVDRSDVPPERLGKLFRITKPVIGVYGTSSSQGKFTLQLALRKKFLEFGYIVGQIGTEPSSELFGIDYTYPMGFNSSVYIDSHDSIAYINYRMNKLCEANCDIIITGSQASVLPVDIGNKSMYPIRQYSFLMGTQPDCMILCVNPYDDLEFIGRTILFLESSVDGKVVAICIYPMKYKVDWSGLYSQKEVMKENEVELLKELLSKKFLIPVYQLGKDSEVLALFEDIRSFFTEE